MCSPASLAGEVGVAGERRVENALVLGVDVARDRALRGHEAAIALGLLVEQGVQAMQPGRRAGGDQRAMEIAVALLEFARRAGRVVAQPLLGLREPVEGRDDVALPGLAADGDRLPQRLGLDQLAHFGQIAEVLERRGATRKPRWPSLVTSASPSSRVSASRMVEPLTS